MVSVLWMFSNASKIFFVSILPCYGEPFREPMIGKVCSDLVRELAWIEKLGCLRYIKINYAIITSVCSTRYIAREHMGREFEDLAADIRASRDACNKIQEMPENMREELYGSVYYYVRRAMERLEKIYEDHRKTYRLYLLSLAGLAVSMTLLAISILLTSIDNIYIFLPALAAGLLSITSMATANSSIRSSIHIIIVSGAVLTLCGIGIGDIVKIAASTIVLVASIATSRRILAKS